MATFRNVTHRPLLVDLEKDAIVVFPGQTFKARPKLKVIRHLLAQNKITRV